MTRDEADTGIRNCRDVKVGNQKRYVPQENLKKAEVVLKPLKKIPCIEHNQVQGGLRLSVQFQIKMGVGRIAHR